MLLIVNLLIEASLLTILDLNVPRKIMNVSLLLLKKPINS